MAVVIINERLENEINKRFKGESVKVFKLLKTLETSPAKGTLLGRVGGIIIKEIRYNSFRFYFLVDAEKIVVYDAAELAELLIRFVRMSDKKTQQTTIDEIKRVLREVGPEGFE